MVHHCQRCGNQHPKSLKMSFFNEDMICPECEEKERNHPDYQKAKEIERQEVLKGNYNYGGIGKPADL